TPGSHHYIVTVPGRGYRFVADVKVREPAADHQTRPKITVEPAARETEQVAPVSQSDHPATVRSLRPVLLAVGAVLALSVVALFFWRAGTQNPPEAPGKTPSTKVAVPEKSIAVLPFANLSADQENAFFTQGVQ